MTTPSPNGSNGRSVDGRFAKGNPGGPGNPLAKRTAAVRSLLLETVTEEDLCEVVQKLVSLAKAGDTMGKTRSIVEAPPYEPPDFEFPDRALWAETQAALAEDER